MGYDLQGSRNIAIAEYQQRMKSNSFKYISSKNDFLRLFTRIQNKAHFPTKRKIIDPFHISF